MDSAAAPVGLRPLEFAAARDGWLPIERCSRRIVPQLERAGYEVRYREFDGGHVVPPEIGREAADWFTAT